MTADLKQWYWALHTAWRRWRHPASTSYSPHPWMDAIARNLPADLDRVVYVDGGAHDGLKAREFLERFPSLEVHAFEPNVDLFAQLQANLDGVPGSAHCKALAAESRPLEILVNDLPMTSSILPRNEFSRRYFDEATRTREVRSIQAVSLDDWFDTSRLDRVDILKLDLQGYEGEALKGASRLLRRGVACVFCEVNFIPFYEGSALFADLDSLLRAHGYRLYNIYNLCTHLPEGQIGSADALWVFEGAPPIAAGQPSLAA